MAVDDLNDLRSRLRKKNVLVHESIRKDDERNVATIQAQSIVNQLTADVAIEPVATNAFSSNQCIAENLLKVEESAALQTCAANLPEKMETSNSIVMSFEEDHKEGDLIAKFEVSDEPMEEAFECIVKRMKHEEDAEIVEKSEIDEPMVAICEYTNESVKLEGDGVEGEVVEKFKSDEPTGENPDYIAKSIEHEEEAEEGEIVETCESDGIVEENITNSKTTATMTESDSVAEQSKKEQVFETKHKHHILKSAKINDNPGICKSESKTSEIAKMKTLAKNTRKRNAVGEANLKPSVDSAIEPKLENTCNVQNVNDTNQSPNPSAIAENTKQANASLNTTKKSTRLNKSKEKDSEPKTSEIAKMKAQAKNDRECKVVDEAVLKNSVDPAIEPILGDSCNVQNVNDANKIPNSAAVAENTKQASTSLNTTNESVELNNSKENHCQNNNKNNNKSTEMKRMEANSNESTSRVELNNSTALEQTEYKSVKNVSTSSTNYVIVEDENSDVTIFVTRKKKSKKKKK